MQNQDGLSTSIVSQWQWSRNFHYLRYGIFAFYLVALGTLPNWLQSEFLSLRTVGYFGMALSFLCFVMDIRNYVLFREEERFIRRILRKPEYSPPIVTWVLTLFYIGSFILFLGLATQTSEKQIILTDEAAKRIGHETTSVIVTSEKMIHLPGGWTKVRNSDGIEYLLGNDEIKEIRNVTKEESLLESLLGKTSYRNAGAPNQVSAVWSAGAMASTD